MKILFVTNKAFICNSNFGGAQCAKRNYILMSKLYGSQNVQYIIFSDEIDSCECEDGLLVHLKKSNIAKYFNLLFKRDCFSAKDKKKIVTYIRKVLPDIVFFDGSSFGLLGKYFNNYTTKIVFYHNVEKRYAWSRVLHTSPICIIKFFSFWANEKYITKKASLRICLNERDNELLKKEYHVSAHFILPISMIDILGDNYIGNNKETKKILFVGSYFMPNIKGIRWFCKNVMPYVNKELIIVGKKMELLRNELETKHIKVVGTVEHLEEYYQMSDAVVMPIFIGDGMKVKTAEALMYGKPILATDEALEGYEVENIKGIYRCNTAKQFIDQINALTLYGYQEKIRKLFLEKYSMGAVYKRFSDWMNEIRDDNNINEA